MRHEASKHIEVEGNYSGHYSTIQYSINSVGSSVVIVVGLNALFVPRNGVINRSTVKGYRYR